jgi:hypothetical protein
MPNLSATKGGSERSVVSVALVVKLIAKEGREEESSEFLADAVDLANNEAATPVWFPAAQRPPHLLDSGRVPR